MNSSAEPGVDAAVGSEPARRAHSIDGLPTPTGPFSQSVSFGGLIFVSGLRGIDPVTGLPAATDDERVRLIFQHLRGVLNEHRAAPSDVLMTRVYVTDMKGIRPLVNDAYVSFFGEHLPARTIVEVAALNQGDSVELETVIADRSGSPGGSGS